MGDYPIIPCPKCSRRLRPDGEVRMADARFPLYTCPECVTRRMVFGEMEEGMLMFYIGPDGKPYGPGITNGVIDPIEPE